MFTNVSYTINGRFKKKRELFNTKSWHLSTYIFLLGDIWYIVLQNDKIDTITMIIKIW